MESKDNMENKQETYQDLESNYPKIDLSHPDPLKDIGTIIVVDKDKLEGEFTKRYFTPSLEDIRVGYECEINPSPKLNPANWVKHKIGEIKTFLHDDFYRLIEPYLHTNSLESYIRVPYLTKEQIEKEGWIVLLDVSNITTLIYKDYKVIFKYSIYEIAISKKLENGKSTYVYMGKCKDINTFRYICKLLGI